MKILVFYSEGKDSQACLIWAVKQHGAENCEAVFCDTGWENPVTYEHIVQTTSQLNVKKVEDDEMTAYKSDVMPKKCPLIICTPIVLNNSKTTNNGQNIINH